MKKIIIAQFIILLCGTLFAWGNFIWELINFLNAKPCTIGCVISTAPVNPIYAPCFFGALFFTAAFILSAILLKKLIKK